MELEINRMLKQLDTRGAKEEALKKWHSDRRLEIDSRKLNDDERTKKLKELDDQVKHVRARLWRSHAQDAS